MAFTASTAATVAAKLKVARVLFRTRPYTGNRPDKLGRHKVSMTHTVSQTTYQEWQTRTATNSTVLNLVEGSNMLTVDENAFCDAMHFMYFLH